MPVFLHQTLLVLIKISVTFASIPTLPADFFQQFVTRPIKNFYFSKVWIQIVDAEPL